MFEPIVIACFIISLGISVLLLALNSKENKYWIPGIWTAIGIFGTFLSLLTNIQTVTDATFQDVVLMTEFIKDFAAAFWTSLIGIGGSLVVKILIKVAEHLQEGEFKKQNKA